MASSRRDVLRLATGAAALVAVPRVASAQAYPARPVKWVVGYAPAGGNDIVARLMGQWLSERTGQQFIVENRPGAATNIATEFVANAAPDGYTVLLLGVAGAINATYYDNLSFNFMRDIQPIAGIPSMGHRCLARREAHPRVGQKEMLDVCPMRGMEPDRVESDSEHRRSTLGKAACARLDDRGTTRPPVTPLTAPNRARRTVRCPNDPST